MNIENLISQTIYMTLDRNSLKHSGMKIEDISLGSTYAVSINPESQPKSNKQVDVYIWYREWYDILVQLSKDNPMKLYIESSPTGRYHFHGNIVINDYHKYINLLRLLKNICTYEFDTLTHDNSDMHTSTTWEIYISKQSAIWKPYFEKNVIGYPMDIAKNNILQSSDSKDA